MGSEPGGCARCVALQGALAAARAALEAVLASPYLCERLSQGQRCAHPGCQSNGPFVARLRAALNAPDPGEA